MRIRALAVPAFVIALGCAAPMAEEIYFRGLGEVFSLGVCSVGPGECRSFLSVEAEIRRLCDNPPRGPVRVVGHSLGASAALRAVHGLADCGVKVDAAALLDPMTHPYDIPRGTRILSIYSTTYAGVGEGRRGARFYPGGHIAIANDANVLAEVRAFLRGGRGAVK